MYIIILYFDKYSFRLNINVLFLNLKIIQNFDSQIIFDNVRQMVNGKNTTNSIGIIGKSGK